MARIRDLVEAVRRRDGVEAAIVLGRDGLLVDGETVSYLDGEQVAAHAPAVFAAADALGRAARAGHLQTAVLEFPGTIALVTAMSEDALLVVLARPTAALPPLLAELRRLRQHLATLA
jgi:predicted regulator of Ras-like GTPase activity (Roadblock/LC7/MglB family)